MSRKRAHSIIIIAIFVLITFVADLSLFSVNADAVDGFSPIGIINYPVSDITLSAGGSVYFNGTGFSDNATMTFYWDFDGGSTDSLLEVPGLIQFSTIGTYFVSFIVIDDETMSSIPATLTVFVIPSSINSIPNGDISAPTAGFTGQNIDFDASASTDSDGTIVTYQWDFGDTNTAVGITPSHTYTLDGAYTVILTLIDDDGAIDVTAHEIDIFPSGAPVAFFSGIPLSGPYPLKVTFTDSSITEDFIISWDWDFGDGVTSTLQNPVHTYNSEGRFDVTLTVAESIGPTDTLVKTDYVRTRKIWRGPGLVVGRCFIATAAYGSYWEPRVLTLRAFRDTYLLTNRPGRAFVKLYYRYSPPGAEFISRHPLLRAITRVILTPLVYLSEFLLYTSLFVKSLVLISILTLSTLATIHWRKRRAKA